MHSPSTLSLRSMGRSISIHCDHTPTLKELRDHFAALTVPVTDPDLGYRISRDAGAFHVGRHGSGSVGMARDVGQLIYLLDSDLVVQLQLMRPDLLFLHAAALIHGDGSHLLVGRSGAGKSTTCWGLLHYGLGYLSDELAPIHLPAMMVQPFPRALCMKTLPPAGFELSPNVPTTSRGFHVPIFQLPSFQPPVASELRTLVFIEYAPDRHEPTVRRIGRAEAATRLYPNVLNALAHADAALPAVTRVAGAARAFVVDAAELSATCEAIQAVMAA